MLPLACVVGDLSLIRALGRAGIPVALVTSAPTSSAARSRYVREVVAVPSFVEAPELAVRALLEFGRRQAVPPVLFVQGDHDLVAVSEARDALRRAFAFTLPPRELVRDLVDKVRFAALAERVGLPTPPTRTLLRGASLDEQVHDWHHFPAVLKPSMRTRWFGSRLIEASAGGGGNQKALRLESAAELQALVPLLAAHETDFVLQRAIAGGEERIVSYHAYARRADEIVAEFTGKKRRTSPRRYGLSSCVEITDDAEVLHAGRAVLALLDFVGVVKLDFKREPGSERLYLLEANPRFNLWHHPGALAGVNLPEAYYLDLSAPGTARAQSRVRPGIVWMSARQDLRALREYRAQGELSPLRWLFELVAADIREDLSLGDPAPTFAELFELVRQRAGRLFARPGGAAGKLGT